ncbi:dethiobiotin synthase [Nocardioides sambongensis]|uniref:dethiobiotin synthase n=1 Tax=Nocardioides sambongensis TaxID=2589074 RepID=UPI00112972AB|nr:dethiobiotin synthase [Nocardioides sambongensis]
MTRIVLVTGTDTGVGKTVTTAALAAAELARGARTAVVKPVQTGIGAGPGGPGAAAGAVPETPDVEEVARLAGCSVHEWTRLAAPLAPDTAARLERVALPPIAQHAARLLAMATDHDTLLVEGAGGLLVRLDDAGGTLLDLARHLRDAEAEPSVVVVCRAGLGTLNHATLTVATLRAAGFEPAGLVIGAWPASPGLAERCNLEDLPRVTGTPLLTRIPEGAGAWDPDRFRTAAASWFAAR